MNVRGYGRLIHTPADENMRFPLCVAWRKWPQGFDRQTLALVPARALASYELVDIPVTCPKCRAHMSKDARCMPSAHAEGRMTMSEFTLSSEQIDQIIEKAFAAGFNSRPFYLDWPDHAQAFMDWCDLESERMRIHPGTVPVHGWVEGR